MRSLLLTVVLLALPAAASAQVCPYGLVPVDPAHCCWPGQTFAADRGTCAGVPQCPPGLSPYGETCIVAEAPAQPQPLPAAQPLPDAQPLPPPPPVAQPVPPPPPMPAGYAPMQTAMPQVYGYPVRFEAKHAGQEFTVSVDKGIACRTPCELTVAPGRHRVKVEGDARFREDLNCPASPTVVQVERRKGGRAALGIVGLAVGIPAAVIGAGVGLVGYVSYSLYAPGTATNTSGRDLMIGGFLVAAAGVTFAAVGAGVGFGTAGKNRVRFARATREEPDEAPAVQLVSLGVAPTDRGATMGATFAF